MEENKRGILVIIGGAEDKENNAPFKENSQAGRGKEGNLLYLLQLNILLRWGRNIKIYLHNWVSQCR